MLVNFLRLKNRCTLDSNVQFWTIKAFSLGAVNVLVLAVDHVGIAKLDGILYLSR